MVIRELVKAAADALMDNARFEAEQMVMRALGINRTQLITDWKKETSDEDACLIREMVNRRKNGEPLQYILGECEFMSLPFRVKKGVLIPRPDTETLVETVIKESLGNEKILDICSGSGCIGISLAHFILGAEVLMLDISGEAVKTAKENIALNNLTDRVKVQKMDILREHPGDKFDIIVSNPPYIETDVIDGLQTEVKDFEPRIALDGGGDGLAFYRGIISAAPDMLTENGFLAFEIGYNQGERVKRLMETDFSGIQIIKDLGGNDRVVTGRKRK